MIRTAIIDDEPLARRILHDLLAADAEVEIVAEGDGASLVEGLEDLSPSLLFLDIEMPEVSGFDLLESFAPEAMPVVIFVSAFDRYALRAFEVHAIDYLLKPFSDERFHAALAQAKKRLREQGRPSADELSSLLTRLLAGASERAPRERVDRLLVPVGQKTVVVRCEDIDWIEAADYYARLHCGEKAYLLRESLGALEQKLDPQHFVRVHRSAIVQLDRIAEVHPHFRSEKVVVLRDGTRVTVSAARGRLLEERLAGPAGT